MTESHVEIVWTDYMEYRARLRGFDLAKVEQIVRYSGERYVDAVARDRASHCCRTDWRHVGDDSL